mmetsp:Transcript_18875/g.44234  ORF Transcript_18875/g.44234 Transcript_18875/m.44234 type:complete len:284 (-) Transcript_18875:75-926(-)
MSSDSASSSFVPSYAILTVSYLFLLLLCVFVAASLIRRAPPRSNSALVARYIMLLAVFPVLRLIYTVSSLCYRGEAETIAGTRAQVLIYGLGFWYFFCAKSAVVVAWSASLEPLRAKFWVVSTTVLLVLVFIAIVVDSIFALVFPPGSIQRFHSFEGRDVIITTFSALAAIVFGVQGLRLHRRMTSNLHSVGWDQEAASRTTRGLRLVAACAVISFSLRAVFNIFGGFFHPFTDILYLYSALANLFELFFVEVLPSTAVIVGLWIRASKELGGELGTKLLQLR